MDGWITCDFTFFSTVFQSYQDDGRFITKGCVLWNSVYVEKISTRAGSYSQPYVPHRLIIDPSISEDCFLTEYI